MPETTVNVLLTTDEVCEILKISAATLYGWRHKGVGPRAVRVGRHLRFVAADVDAWINARRDPVDGRRAWALPGS